MTLSQKATSHISHSADRVHNHLIPGLGAIRFQEVFNKMISLGYNGDISLELYPYVNAPDEAGRQSLDFLRPIFEETGLEVGI